VPFEPARRLFVFARGTLAAPAASAAAESLQTGCRQPWASRRSVGPFDPAKHLRRATTIRRRRYERAAGRLVTADSPSFELPSLKLLRRQARSAACNQQIRFVYSRGSVIFHGSRA